MLTHLQLRIIRHTFNNFPANQLEKWLDLYSHRFQNPHFRRLFQSELETVYEEKNISMDDTFGVLFETVLENVATPVWSTNHTW